MISIDDIKEDFLYYIWQSKMLGGLELKTFDGQYLEIENYGYRNDISGPDFTGAKLKIGDVTWAGNVEMHVKASDWFLHQHQKDKAYNNVILHVVWINDMHIDIATRINPIPTLELQPLVKKEILATYQYLKQSKSEIPCKPLWKDEYNSDLTLSVSSFTIGRLENKVAIFQNLLDDHDQDWNTAFFIQMSKYFGGTTNKSTFERLGKAIPYSVFAKNAYDPIRIESILFGIAGFLDEANSSEEYYLSLQNEYQAQKTKYQLVEIYKHEWKYGKMLPAGFPTIRIAQLASILTKHQNIVDQLLNTNSTADIYKIFQVQPHEYWNTHFVFGKIVNNKNAIPTKDFIDRIIINAVVPFYFTYGKMRGIDKYVDQALDILDSLKAENNTIVKIFQQLGYELKTSIDSQGLIHLYQELCTHKKCTDCPVGRKIFKEGIL